VSHPSTRLSGKLSNMASDVFHCDVSESAGYVQDWHAHDCHMLLLPRHGSLFLSTEHTPAATPVSRQSFSVVPPQFAHATIAAPGKERHIALYVDPHYIQHFGEVVASAAFSRNANQSGIWHGSEALDTILLLHDQLSLSTNPQVSARQRLHLNHLMFEECARIIEHARPSTATDVQPWQGNPNAALIRQIQAYITTHLKDDLNVDQVCYQFHLSRRHLTRLFKTVSEETFVDFTNRARVEAAANLIINTRMSILEVSLEVGIDSPSYLARLFKRYMGLLPNDLRKPS